MRAKRGLSSCYLLDDVACRIRLFRVAGIIVRSRFRGANRNLTPPAGRVEICDGGGPKPLLQNETVRGSRNRHLRRICSE
jgi:hypothetical protein